MATQKRRAMKGISLRRFAISMTIVLLLTTGGVVCDAPFGIGLRLGLNLRLSLTVRFDGSR